jgi:hypothetical protein
MIESAIVIPDDQDTAEQSIVMKSHAIEELVNEFGYDADELSNQVIDAYLLGAQLALGKVTMAMDNLTIIQTPPDMSWTGCFVGNDGVHFWLEKRDD